MLYLPGPLQTSKVESFATKLAIVRVINYCCNSSPSEMFPEGPGYASTFRSSRPGVFCKKGVLKNIVKFTGKHLCLSLFFNKVAGLKPATLLKKRLWHWCFFVNFEIFLRKPFLWNTSGGCFSTLIKSSEEEF